MKINNVNVTNQVTQNTKTKTAEKTSSGSFDQYLTKASSSTTTLDDIFQKAADKYDVPVNLLKAIGYAESNFKADATSHCGAQGIMQLMPATAKSLGVEDAYDPEQNIMGGAKYISSLLKKYDGDVKLSLAAYNAGSGNVAKYGGIPPFKETQNYVVKVTNYMKQNLDGSQIVSTTGSSSNSSNKTNSNSVSSQTEPYTPVFLDEEGKKVYTTDDLMDEIFSYDNYMKFLSIFSGDDDDSNKKNTNQDASLSQMNLSPKIANLLRGLDY